MFASLPWIKYNLCIINRDNKIQTNPILSSGSFFKMLLYIFSDLFYSNTKVTQKQRDKGRDLQSAHSLSSHNWGRWGSKPGALNSFLVFTWVTGAQALWPLSAADGTRRQRLNLVCHKVSPMLFLHQGHLGVILILRPMTLKQMLSILPITYA